MRKKKRKINMACYIYNVIFYVNYKLSLSNFEQYIFLIIMYKLIIEITLKKKNIYIYKTLF